jgi:hypothetical protein
MPTKLWLWQGLQCRIVFMKLMKSILLACSILSASFVNANNWSSIGLFEAGTFYIDTDSVTVLGHHRKVWTSLDYRSPQVNQHTKKMYKSTRMQLEFDCNEKTVRTLSLSFHTGVRLSGETLSSEGVINQFEGVPPDTPIYKIMRRVC